MQSDFIYHDLQRGVFYLVNKQTGTKQLAHKNGQLAKRFKADVTGNDYKLRKTLEFPHKQHSLRKQTLFDKLESRKHKLLELIPAKKKTLQDSRVGSRYEESSFRMENSVGKDVGKDIVAAKEIVREQESSLGRNSGMKGGMKGGMKSNNGRVSSRHEGYLKQNLRMKSVESESNFVTHFNLTEQKVSQRNKSEMEGLLRSFSKIKEQSLFQNHSAFNKNQGRIIIKKLVNSRGFRETKNTVYEGVGQTKKMPSMSKRQPENILPKSTISSQLSKERLLFLQFHPSLIQIENPRFLDQQMERNKNLKKLESLFLEESAKQTNKIYTGNR